MEREFLENLGLDAAAIQQILDENSRDVDREIQKTQAAESDLSSLRQTLEQREYDDAVLRAVGGLGLKFSSKAAERDFAGQARAKKLELKDGQLLGLDEFLQEQRSADPGAFASTLPVPQIVAPVGVGAPSAVPANVARAREMGAERAAALKTSSEILKNFL